MVLFKKHKHLSPSENIRNTITWRKYLTSGFSPTADTH